MMGGKAKEDSVMKTMVIFCLALLFFPVFLYFFSKAAFFEGTVSILLVKFLKHRYLFKIIANLKLCHKNCLFASVYFFKVKIM